MAARLVFLGRLEELAGCPFADVAFGAPLHWADVLAWLGDDQAPELPALVNSDKVRLALNGMMVTDKASLTVVDGDELAFLPPVSGG
ncbi:MoaD/ThiS family protein [Novosphingobium sp. Leaf2]|uniref:MoaD/ThiS family protein n=1 Tax=Novosphingobium sp. Leaf2 TaxID=1735670 RepID=UPI0006F589A5|nr:MoaD/ThiS family protein [Novosphingobium sp. Leaf2]KQM18320.1 molybdopterin synthase sulfur carrier subunit [Novosphingobium sp. Leaf2]